MPKAGAIDEVLLAQFEQTKEIMAGIRTIRLEKNIPNKEQLALQIVGNDALALQSVVEKMANLSAVETVAETVAGATSFRVGTTEYAVPLGSLIDVEAELKKLNEELKYQEGFLISVNKKLSNEKFVANAKPEIVANERKKLADAESKIASLKESIVALSK